MNLKLWTIALSIASAAAVGCVVQPDNTLDATGGSGGTGGSSSKGGGSSTGGSSNTGGTGGSSSTGVVAGKAKAFFISDVHKALAPTDMPTVNCAVCHAPPGASGAPIFLDVDPAKAYDAVANYPGLISIPESSMLLLHGKHAGPELSKTQYDITAQWLTMEAEERGLAKPTDPTTTGGMPPPPVLTLEKALTQFGQCMSLNDWLANGLDQMYKTQTVLGGQKAACQACHVSGTGGWFLNANANQTFDMQQLFPYVNRWVTGKYDMTGNFIGLEALPRAYMKGQEAAKCDLAKEACHPMYLADQVNGGMTQQMMAAVDNFIKVTLDKWDAKQCPGQMP